MSRLIVIRVTLVLLGLMLGRPALAHDEAEFAGPIEQGHNLEAWAAQAAIHGHVTVKWGEHTVIDGHLLFDTPVGKVLIKQDDGTRLVFDGQDAWIAPADAKFPMARFHLLTWPYFIAAPFKLSDPGTHIVPAEKMHLDDRVMPAAKLTFDGGVGDSSDDWYILFRDAQTGRLEGMAYIVTYGGVDAAEAEKVVHAVRYDKFETIDGVLIPTKFSFYNWNAEQGIHGDIIGQVEFSHAQFVDPGADAFTKPDDAKLDPLPGVGQ